jgi:hypothetical protein
LGDWVIGELVDWWIGGLVVNTDLVVYFEKNAVNH